MKRNVMRGVWGLAAVVTTVVAVLTTAAGPATARDGDEAAIPRIAPQRAEVGNAAEGVGRMLRAQGETASAPADLADGPRRTLASQTKWEVRVSNDDAGEGDAGIGAPDDNAAGVAVVESLLGGPLCTQPAENCQAQDNFDARNSNWHDFVLADDFTPAVSGNVTDICWWGTYFDGTGDCQGVAADEFEINYYADSGGVPGALLASFTQVGGTLNVTGPSWTEAYIAGDLPEYEYIASHAAVAVEAGRCYWIEISNPMFDCSWFWEIASQGNGRALQDGDGASAPNGYDHDDLALTDLAFCLDASLGDTASCMPPPPANNACAGAEVIAGDGTWPFDGFAATTTGPPHAGCTNVGDDQQLSFDLWYCWTAPCTDTAFVRTCELTEVDTKLAVYEGCACPATDANLLVCNDDICGDLVAPLQSMVTFAAVQGQSYLIRIGTFPGGGGFPPEPGGTGQFTISCGPPANAACPGTGDCCEPTDPFVPGCDNEACCQTVCACDPFCCDVFWDTNCAKLGFQNAGCGAAVLCSDVCNVCGNPASGDCCTPAEPFTPGCDDEACCETVCDCDAYCCDVEWDNDCATDGFNDSGCGAAVLCPDLCGQSDCPEGTIEWVDPPDGVVDARQPHPPDDAALLQGIDTILVNAPLGAERVGCWSLCETAVTGALNGVAGVVDNGGGSLTIQLKRPITPGAVTTITYEGTGSMATFISHPANVNGDSSSAPTDILALIDCCLNQVCDPDPTWGEYSCDVDHSEQTAPADILRVIDLLNGADALDSWLGVDLPECGSCCP